MEPRIYVVLQNVNGKITQSLVRAKNRQQAVAYVARNTISATIAKQEQLLGKNPEDVQNAVGLGADMSDNENLTLTPA
jgi:hypothetical protein